MSEANPYRVPEAPVLIFGEERRCVHDYIADTIVVVDLKGESLEPPDHSAADSPGI